MTEGDTQEEEDKYVEVKGVRIRRRQDTARAIKFVRLYND